MKSMLLGNETIPSDQMIQSVTGSIFLGYGVLIAYKVGLFLALSYEDLYLDQLVSRLSLEERSVQALLSALAAFNLVEKKEDGCFQLSRSGRYYLAENSPAYYGDVFDLYLAQIEDISFSKIESAVLTSQPTVYANTDLFDKHREKEAGKVFTSSMHAKSFAPSQIWPKKLSLKPSDHLIDIGGGSGIHAISACKAVPMTATICDLEEVLCFSRPYVIQENLESQISFCALNMWEDPLPEGSIHFYSDIFHDWQIDDNRQLAAKSYEALIPGGKIVINEMLFNSSKTGPDYTSAYNLKMLYWTKGNQYTADELLSILDSVGFSNTQVIPYFGCWSLIVGEKQG